jgi:lipopolysaccharide/colanic/teichoic acid biosynthesis glycosyltransferase
VEGRDSPSFEAYRRLDLFYVENWSLTLDLIIVLGTVEQILFRLIRIVVSRRVHGGTQQVAEVQVLTVDA